jgi:predicted nucleic acid-binding protein
VNHLILDTGPLVALLCRDDAWHEWAKQQFARFPGPFLSCEAVIAEATFLLARAGFDPSRVLMLVERGVVRIGMSLIQEVQAVRALFQQYGNVPASLADACLIRMSECFSPSSVITLDSDFYIYRRHGREPIPLISPRS